MTEHLNEYFSLVFTREDISILPVLQTKFEGGESDYLGQLIVTPKMVAIKIRDMKDNNVDGQHVDDLILTYNTFLSDCLDKHAPWRNVRIKSNSPHPWYDTEVDEARRKRRVCENVWRRTQLEIHRQIYIKAGDDCTTMFARKKTQHYREQLQNANIKDMFSILRSFDVQRLQLPAFCLMVDGCDTFSRFIPEKIDKLLVNLHRTTAVDSEPLHPSKYNRRHF